MKLIVGLGNPGEKYRFSRHNFGFLIVEALAKEVKAKFRYSIFAKAKIASFKRGDKEIVLMLPLTFMNLSGRSVNFLVKKRHVALEDILVVCDDVNLPFGKIRVRASGSDGGHNGLNSIIDNLNSGEFARLRVGVGIDSSNDLAEFVLSEFNRQEKKELDSVINNAVNAVLCWLDSGLQTVMNKHN